MCAAGICSTHPNMGSGLKGWRASWVTTQAAAAWPNSAGVVPSTGIVRTRKLGTTCRMFRCKNSSGQRDGSEPALVGWASLCPHRGTSKRGTTCSAAHAVPHA